MVSPSMLTCRSAIAPKQRGLALGGVRLISSAIRRLVKIGGAGTRNCPDCMS